MQLYLPTKQHFLVRAFEHLAVYLRTGKKYMYNPNNNNNSTTLQHLHQSEECNGELNDFQIIGKVKNDICLRIKESLLVQKFKASLNCRFVLSLYCLNVFSFVIYFMYSIN